MNIYYTYLYLKNPFDSKNTYFTEADDQIIKNMKGSEDYNLLVRHRGEDKVLEREDFLLG